MNPAVFSLEKNTGRSRFLFLQRQPGPVFSQRRVVGHEFIDIQFQESGDSLNLFLGKHHFAGPFAAAAAPLALVENALLHVENRHFKNENLIKAEMIFQEN